MDWATLLRLPTTMLLVLAAVLALVTLVQLVAVRQRLQRGRRLAASWRALLCLTCFALTLLLAGAGYALRGYRLLGEEAPVVEIDARILSPQRWDVTLNWPDGSTRQVQLAGDQWRIEAVVLKWKLPALLAGVPPLYRLDRLSGRYDDAAQEMNAPRTVIGFGENGGFDLLDLKKQYPRWLPEVDTVYGSGAFLPLVDQGHYTVSLMRTGALVARPDEATERRIGQPLGG
ncbi:hypothetical protein I6J77_17630 [Rhodanobacter sp. FDAARGOS 1247]|uniref:hypothetical protein n=1 Tax=Rhodanobacter sp. FDAARGOS 1247 TaxID=2778082 RepID=UPI001950E323|nr:hypothetical protein [Rhodanobacter sp. FDAARGOS 1247]QRP65745.1 hypothetical protein I6J77_17630 [Rhodanobacter sp. FDAARGOS 1247]